VGSYLNKDRIGSFAFVGAGCSDVTIRSEQRALRPSEGYLAQAQRLNQVEVGLGMCIPTLASGRQEPFRIFGGEPKK